jgi:CCR4-NOT transcription complex subunit 6
MLYYEYLLCYITDEREILKDIKNEIKHSLNLDAFINFPFTISFEGFAGVIDFVFYEKNLFELKKVLPLTYGDKLDKRMAFPNQYQPSDHLSIIFEFKIK